MLPHIQLFGTTVSSSIVLIGVVILATFLIFHWGMKSVPLWRKSVLILIAVVAAFVGGRLMHVIWEEPAYFRAHPEMIFANWNGMVFYGSLILGGVAVAIFNPVLIPKAWQKRTWDLTAICTCLGLAFLRLSCFFEGCCWGSPTTVPWAVQYFNPEAVMPWLGIPVHPVQLYESAGAAIIGLILLRSLLLRRYPGKLFLIFLPLYSLLRIVTEIFRGDAGRGESVALGLSTSQLISASILTVYLLVFFLRKLSVRPSGAKAMLAGLVSFLFLSGCLLPGKPDRFVVAKSQKATDALEWNFMAREKKLFRPDSHSPSGGWTTVAIPATGRDALLVAVDDEVQLLFQKPLMEAYHVDSPLRLEEVMWWMVAPVFQKLYDRVLRIPYDQFTTESLLAGIEIMENQKRPYDILLMTHGVPNNLVTSAPAPYFSWEDLGQLKGRLRYAQVVFMQACFGDTLAPDWHAAGVPAVLSYSDFNRNFFYLPYFLENLKKKNWDARSAQEITLAEVEGEIRRSFVLKKIIAAMKMDVDTYLKNAPPPKLTLTH